MAKKTKAPAEAAPEQPYYLQRAHIKGFRSIRDAKVEFKPGLNIIIGPNGAGKSNFVRAVGNAIDVSQTGFVGNDSSFVLAGGETLQFSYGTEMVQPIEDLPPGPENQLVYRQFLTVETALGKAKGASLLQTIAANYRSLFAERKWRSYQLVTIQHGIPEQYPVVAGQDEFMFSGPGSAVFSSEARLPLFILSAISSSLAMEMHHEEGRRLTAKTVQLKIADITHFFLEEIRWLVHKYTPVANIKLADTFKIYYNKNENIFSASGFRFEFQIADQWLPFKALSSGTQRIFYIVSELATPNGIVARINGEETLEKFDFDKIILLEEPELGIHPDQLHLLLSFLREQSEKHQLIITTHSPQVLDMLREDELDRITICELDEKKGTQFRKLNAKSIATAKRYMNEVGDLSDYWRYGSLEEKI